MVVTVQQIARETGLSQPTVSQVLNNKAQRYSADTRQRVLDTAERLGYRPNSAARSLLTGRFNCATLLMGSEYSHNMLSQGLLSGIHDELASNEMHLTLAKLPNELLTDEKYVPRLLREWTADGLLINFNAMIPPALIDLVRKYQLPSVWINSIHPADCVHPADLAGGRVATQKLLDAGHRKIGYVDYNYGFNDAVPPQHYSAVDRRAGYAQMMREMGLTAQFINAEVCLSNDQRLTHMREVLSQPDRPTAIVTVSITDAIHVYVAAQSLGLSLPKDLSLIAFDSEAAFGRHLNIDAMVVPEYQEGREAVRMLMAKIAKPDETVPACVIEMPYDSGGTIAPPAKPS
ncbi:MAG: LacI family DNA-binding transcriptional regulator [Algisphaera sp.]